MEKLFKNPYFVGMLVVLAFIVIFSLNKKVRNPLTPEGKTMEDIIDERLKSIELLDSETEWRKSLEQVAKDMNISYRQAALFDIVAILRSSRDEKGNRLYPDSKIRKYIQDKYDLTVIPVA